MLNDEQIGQMTEDEAKALVRKLKRRLGKASPSKLRKIVPAFDDPREELRSLAKLHADIIRRSVALSNGACDKTLRDGPRKGETIECTLPNDLQRAQQAMADEFKENAKSYELTMAKTLEKFEVYRIFLDKVFGCGVVTSAYLLGLIDIRREGLKPSGVRRYCGYAVVDGKAERRGKRDGWLPAWVCKNRDPHPLKKPTDPEDIRVVDGQEQWFVALPMAYNAALKTRLWQMMSAMLKNAAKCTSDAPYGVTNKYLDRWYDAKHAALTVQGMKPGKAQSKGMRKAIDLFLLDLYTIWRAIEGLPIWPSYYEQQRGYMHGGAPADQGSRTYTVAAALQFVGNFKTVPLQTAREWGAAAMLDTPDDSDS